VKVNIQFNIINKKKDVLSALSAALPSPINISTVHPPIFSAKANNPEITDILGDKAYNMPPA